MAQQLLPESSEKKQPRVEGREPTPQSTLSFKGGQHPVAQLQQTLGNRNVAKLIQTKRLNTAGKIIDLQCKPTICAAEGQLEQETDHIAHQVINKPDTVITASTQKITLFANKARQTIPLNVSIMPTSQRHKENENDLAEEKDSNEIKDEALQAKFSRESTTLSLKRLMAADEEEPKSIELKSTESTTGSFEAGADIETQINQSKGHGKPLPATVRAYMEPRFGIDFSNVHIHTGSDALQMNQVIGAQAFTHGSDIYYGSGHSPANLELTAHELTHVVQQTGGIPVQPIKRKQEINSLCPNPLIQRINSADTVDQRKNRGISSPLSMPVPVSAYTPTELSVSPSSDMLMRDGARDPHASVDTIPAGGTPVDRVGIVAWDGVPSLRLRSSASTAEDNIIKQLALNTHLQVVKELPGKWYFVSTEDGNLGYVAKDYVKTNLPEPNAKLHKVEAGLPGFAISIAEKYYKQWADDWGQDLRFYVNVLAWVNKRTVPDTTLGWRDVHFNAEEFIWIPTHGFARSLRGVVNSGSRSHNIADAIGIADFLDRAGELWDDIRTAIALSKKYIPEAVGRHVEAALLGVLESLAIMLVLAVAILAISTAIGAAVGAIAGAGVGAAPGAAAGFEIGMVLLNWLGLGMLIVWVAQSLIKVGGAFGDFLGGVWNARGDQRQLDRAAHLFAEAIGTLCGVILEGLVMWAASMGATKALGILRGTRFGKSFNNSKTGEWLNERVRRFKAGETAIPTPKDVINGLVREVELVDARNSPVGEFDGIDMNGKRFVENKSATGIDKPNPRTGKPQQTASDWAAKQITKKTLARIKALATAAATRGKGAKPVPSIGEIKGFRHIHFMIDGESPALRAAVFAELAGLRTANPGWTFSAEFGVKILLPPVPGTGQPDE